MAIEPKNDTEIHVDTINEKTTNTGVTVEGVKLENDQPLLKNNTYLLGRNAADSANVNLLRVTSGDVADLNKVWIDWSSSVTFSGSGSMTYTGETVQHFDYLQLGEMVFFSAAVITGTIGGTVDKYILVDLPVAPQRLNWPITCRTSDAGAELIPGECCICSSSPAQARVSLSNGSNWTAGSAGFEITGFYKANLA